MQTPIERKYNLITLGMVTPHLKSMEYCVFFGTLLGVHREGNLLEMDDDVDIYINSQHKTDIAEILTYLGFNISIDENSFMQGSIEIEGVMAYIDFYLYYKDGDHSVDDWNFGGRNGEALHVPLNILLPPKDVTIGDIPCKMPQDPDSCCKLLYGNNYQTPLKKNIEYTICIVDHKPVMRLK